MEVTVKFRRILGLKMPDYDPVNGIRAELPPGATVQDLFKCLNINDPQKTIVTMDYRILKAKDPLPQGADLIIFELVTGG